MLIHSSFIFLILEFCFIQLCFKAWYLDSALFKALSFQFFDEHFRSVDSNLFLIQEIFCFPIFFLITDFAQYAVYFSSYSPIKITLFYFQSLCGQSPFTSQTHLSLGPSLSCCVSQKANLYGLHCPVSLGPWSVVKRSQQKIRRSEDCGWGIYSLSARPQPEQRLQSSTKHHSPCWAAPLPWLMVEKENNIK